MGGAPDIPEFRSAPASHPWPIRALNGAGRLLLRPRPLDAESIWRAARTGDVAECDPTPEAAEALEVLLDSLAANVRMTTIGAFSAKDDTTRLARTHLRIHHALGAASEIDRTPLPPPIFVIGWPRTGTTFLHQLLACDPATRTIPYWESFDPVPPPAGEPDRRTERLDRMLGQLRRIAPRYDAIHPMTAEAPEECVAFFMNELRTLQFDFQYRVPEYARWLIDQDAGVAYDLYRRQLELVLHHRPGCERLLLKDPTHLVHLETIVEGFPDARFVFTHRDPAEAFSSIGSLVAYTRALFTDDVDPHAIGPELLSGYWPGALERSRKIRETLPAGRAIDVRHPDLRADPIATVEGIYAALGLELSDAARAAMRAHSTSRAAGEGGRHYHSLAGIGLSRDAVRDRFVDYCAAFEL